MLMEALKRAMRLLNTACESIDVDTSRVINI